MSPRTRDLAFEVARMVSRARRDGDCLMVRMRGYGTVRFNGGEQMSAHRASYTVNNGPIPDGLIVRHTCDRMGCIEPTHLLLGTYLDNSRDAVDRGRTAAGEAHPAATKKAEVVAQAVAEYLRGGQSQAAVAAKYGITQSCLGAWVRAEHRRDGGQRPFVQGKGNFALARPPKPCGTRAAYARHIAAGEEPCDPCRQVNTDYMRDYKARRRALGRAA